MGSFNDRTNLFIAAIEGRQWRRCKRGKKESLSSQAHKHHILSFVSHRGPNLFIPQKKISRFLYGWLQRRRKKGKEQLSAYRTTLDADRWETERQWRQIKEKQHGVTEINNLGMWKRRGKVTWGGGVGGVRKQRENEMGKRDGARPKRAGELWLLCSMLFRMAPLPNSLKRPGLRFGLPTKRWISAFLWAFMPPLHSPQTRLHTHCFYQLSPCMLVFEVGCYVTLSCSFKFLFAGYGSGINCRLVHGPRKPAGLMSIWSSQAALNWAYSIKVDLKIARGYLEFFSGNVAISLFLYDLQFQFYLQWLKWDGGIAVFMWMHFPYSLRFLLAVWLLLFNPHL